MKRVILILFLISLLCPSYIRASHLMGGSISYEFISVTGNLQYYRVTLEMYRDWNNKPPTQPNPTPFDPIIELGIYYDNSNLDLYSIVTISLTSEDTTIEPPSGGSGCAFKPNVRMSKGIYQTVISVPRMNSGFYLLYERCCRNNLNNLITNMGQSYFAYIPSQVYRNSSAYFNGAPTPYICNNDTIDISYGAIDPDGDSLTYSFVVPYDGASDVDPVPTPPVNLILPLNDVIYNNVYPYYYSFTQPFGSGGLAYIDQNTGLVTIKSPNAGLYALAVEVSEYRNGVLLCKVRRDIEIIVLPCPPNDPPRFIPTSSSGTKYMVDAGDTLSFDILFSDADSIYITHKGNIFGSPGSPPFATLADVKNKFYTTTRFNWITSCTQASYYPYKFSVYARDNGCPNKTKINYFEITVKPPKIPDSISGKKNVCWYEKDVNYTVFGVDTPCTLLWAVIGGNIISGQGTKTIVVDWGKSGPGKVSIVQINRNRCATSIGMMVQINPVPVSEAGANEIVCSERKISLGGIVTDPNYLYEWIPHDSLSNPASSSTFFSYYNKSGIPVIKKYYLKITNTYSCSSIDSLNITINPRPPTQTILGNSTVCFNVKQTYVVSSHLGSNYNWFVKGGIIENLNANAISIIWTDSNKAEIKFVEENLYGCKSDTSRLTISIILPQPKIQGSKVVCPNSHNVRYYVYNSSPGSLYNWGCKNGKRADAGNLTFARFNWGNEGSAKVWVIETTKEGCVSDTSFFPIKISYHLETSAIEGDTFLCELSKNIKYSVFETNGSTYSWWAQNGQINSVNGKADVFIDWLIDGKGLIRVIETSYDSVNNKACQSDPVQLSVTLNPLPETTPISGPVQICQYNSAIYSVIGFTGSIFKWDISGPNNFSGQGTDQIQLNWKTEGTYKMSVVEITKDNCIGNVIDTVVVVHPKPRTSSITGDSIICYPDNAAKIYSVTGFPNSTYHWTITGGDLVINNNDNVEIEWIAGEYGNVKVFELTDYGCQGDNRTKNVILDSLRAEVELVTTAVKNDESIEVYFHFYNAAHMTMKARISKSKPGEQSWVILDSFYAVKTKLVDNFVSTHSLVYDYRIAVWNLCGKIFSSEPHHSILLRGDKISDFDLDLRWNLYTGWDQGVEKYDIYRSLNESKEFSFFEGDFHDTMAKVVSGNDGYKQCYRIVAVKAGDENIKSWSNERCFNFEPKIYVPNSFTPNNDGLNDVFKVVAGNVAQFEMNIYSRWGEKIFHSSSYENSWDGTCQGKACPVGVYLVVINYSGNDHNLTYTGSITLLK